MTFGTPDAGKAPTMMSDWVKALYCCWSNASAVALAVASFCMAVCSDASAACLAAGSPFQVWMFCAVMPAAGDAEKTGSVSVCTAVFALDSSCCTVLLMSEAGIPLDGFW